MSLLAVCVPFLEKCLLILFAHYKMGLFIFSLLGCKRNIYSHKTQSLISHMICNFFFLFCRLSFYFLENIIRAKVFNSDDVQFI